MMIRKVHERLGILSQALIVSAESNEGWVPNELCEPPYGWPIQLSERHWRLYGIDNLELLEYIYGIKEKQFKVNKNGWIRLTDRQVLTNGTTYWLKHKSGRITARKIHKSLPYHLRNQGYTHFQPLTPPMP